MNAAAVMTRAVLTVTPETELAAALSMMLRQRVSGLPVTDAKGVLLGMVTEGDLLQRVEIGTDGDAIGWLRKLFVQGAAADAYVQTHGRRVGDVMTTAPFTVTETTELADVVALMQRHGVKRLPVVEGGRLVGVVSRADLLRAVADALSTGGLSPGAQPPLSDQAVRDRIAAEIERQPWAANVHLTIAVTAGKVVLTGTILDEHCRGALRVAAENVPGVTSVVDELSWVDPTSGVYLGLP